MKPQITPDTPFGQSLTHFARESRTIVEVGAGAGLGSTLCLATGMTLPESWLWTVEGSSENYLELVENLKSHPELNKFKDRIIPQYGPASCGIKPFWHPDPNIQVQAREMWDMELKAQKMGPLHLPDQIDLLLLDGGEFTSDGDFLTLWHRAKVIALDDINPQKAVKNCYAHTQLDQAGWGLVASDLHDRNGWSIWRRP